MKSEINDFIGVYDDVFSPMYCDQLIDYYEWCNKNNRTWRREETESQKNDGATGLSPLNHSDIEFCSNNLGGYIDEFNRGFWDTCYADYIKQFSVLGGYDRHTIHSYKVQKTLPGEGYHIWHCENGEKHNNNRIGVYILYLNDVEAGGETEFLYMSRRVEAKKGRLVIFPPNYPWAHRGNPPLSGEKYIMTGWIEFA
jgi:hypothetical protein